jgi:hypothetical protein
VHRRRIDRATRTGQEIRRDLPSQSTEGGEIILYVANGDVRRMIAHLYGEIGHVEYRFYRLDGQFRTVVTRTDTYDRPLSGVTISRVIDRFDFDDGRLVRWLPDTLSPGRSTTVNRDSVRERAADILGWGDSLRTTISVR